MVSLNPTLYWTPLCIKYEPAEQGLRWILLDRNTLPVPQYRYSRIRRYNSYNTGASDELSATEGINKPTQIRE
jgi:hypothetical protein